MNAAFEAIDPELAAGNVVCIFPEGGLTTEEYMDLFQPDMDSPVDIVSLAMSIEAQALDLYQRVTQKVSNEKSKKILQQIANEEKTHLKSLGELLDSL